MIRQRYIPEGSTEVKRDDLPAVVYLYQSPRNPDQFSAIAYAGKSNKPAWHYRFRDDANRQKKISDFFDHIAYCENVKSQRRAERKSFRHGFVIGDILYSSWGYDQTNVEFYQVIATTEKTVTLQEIGKEAVPGSAGFMCESVIPIKDKFFGQPFTRNVTPCSNDPKGAVNYAEHPGGYSKRLWAWDGTPKHSSWYG